MNRKLTPPTWASFALFCFACSGASVEAQTNSGNGISGYSGSGMTGNSVSKNAYLTNSGNAYVNGKSNYPGSGMTIPPCWAYGAYRAYGDGSGCGLRGYYQQNFGGITRGCGPICGSHCGYNGCPNCCFVSYGCGRYGYAGNGYGNCGNGNSYGCRTAFHPCSPACCSPMANCSGAMSSGAEMIQPATVVPMPGHASPTRFKNTVTAPTPDATNPAPSPDPASPAAPTEVPTSGT